MHLTPKKRIEVYPDTKVVVLRDDVNNQVVHMYNKITQYQQRQLDRICEGHGDPWM